MARIKVVYDGYFGAIAGRRSEEVDFPGGTMADLVRSLGQRHGPRFLHIVLDPATGEVAETVGLLVNGQRPPLTLMLREGDEVAFLMALAGG